MDNWMQPPTSDVTLEAPPMENPDQVTLVAPGATALPPRGKVAQDRAKRYDMAMGENSPGPDELEASLVAGQEPFIRNNAAINEESRQRRERTQKLISQATSGQFDPNIAYQAYQEYTQPIKINPDTVLEETFGINYLKTIFGINQSIAQIRQRAMEEDPQATMAAIDGTQRLLARQQIAVRAYEDAEARSGSWASINAPVKALHTLGTMLPMVSNLNIAGVENRSVSNTVFGGDYLEQAGRKFWSFRDLDEARDWLEGEIRRIEKFNPEDAVNFARAMVDQNMEDKWVNNVIGVVDVTPIGTIAAGAKMAASTQVLRRLLGHSVQGVADGVKMENVLVAVGDVDRAADVINAKRNFSEKDPLNLADAIRELPWSHNLDARIEKNPGSMAADRARKLVTVLRDQWTKMLDDATKSARVQRVPKDVHDELLTNAKARIEAEFPSVNDHIINHRLRYEPLNNAYYGEVMVANPDGTFLKTRAQVERLAERLGLEVTEYKIATDPDFIGINSAGMAAIKALDPVRAANKVPGFNSIQGTVRLKDGTEVRVSNKKDGIYTIPPKDKPAEGSYQATWKNKDNDLPVTVLPEKAQMGPDGKLYQKVRYEGKDSYVPLSELDASDARPVKGIEARRIDPSEITHYKTSAKGSTWTNVPSETRKKVEGLFKGNFIKQQGTGYYLSIVRAADETDPLVRAALLTLENTNPVSFANYAFGSWFRSAEDQVAYFQRGNRHIATHAPNAILGRLAETAQVIGQMSKNSHGALEVVLIRNRDYVETVNGELVRGRAFKSQSALEKEWMDAHKRLPTEQESLAYWTYHQLMDLDWVLRNTGVHRDLARVGVSERYTVFMGEERNEIKFPGKFVTELPTKSKGNPGILIIEEGQPVNHVRLADFGKEGKPAKEAIDALLEKGYRILQVANPVDRPFKKHTGSGATVNYVITKDSTSEPLPMNLVDRNPGVHVQYPHEWYIKQPIVEIGEGGRNIYYGDRTILPARSEREAQRLYKALDQLREMFVAGKTQAEVEDFIGKHLPKDYDFWHEKFYGKGAIEPHLSLAHPIRHTHSGEQIVTRHRDLLERSEFKELVNERNTEFNLMRNIDMDFMADRNAPLMEAVNKGSIDKPMWEMETARVLDPMVTINRALANSVRTQYLNDIKVSAIEQWARQFGKYLTQPHLAENNPFQAFYHGELVKTADNARELQAAYNVRARILNFVGTKTELGRDLDWFNAKVMNATEKLAGEKAVNYYSEHELRFVKDPIGFMRSLLFHAKFGIPGNIKQFVVQAQGFATTLGVMTGAHGPIEGPKMTAMAMAAYAFQRGVDLTDYSKITNHIANKVAAWGWNKQHYLEASKWMKDDGWKIIGNEHAYRDSFDPDIFSNGKNKFLAIGTAPFYEGERLTRMVGGFAAYLEWRKANPTAVFDDFAKAAVATRADDLSSNMTRASHSMMQEGVFRFPTQFYTFSQRIMEQYWSGQRFTWKEKAGLFTTQSILYGVPAALGATTFVIPVYDMIRSQVLDEGKVGIGPAKVPVNIKDAWFQGLTEGWVQYLMYHITGKQYDVQGRYGPGPSDQAMKILQGDRDWFEILGGATGTFTRDVFLGALAPVYKMLYTAVRGGDERYQPTWNDIQPLLKQFAVYNDYHNAIVMANTGKYLSKNGRLVADKLTGLDAAMIVMGLQNRSIKDAYLNQGTLKNQEEVQTKAMQEAMKEYRIAIQYLRDRDYSKADVHFMNANVNMVVFGDLTDRQMKQVRDRVHSELGTLIEEVNKQMLERGYKSRIPERLRRVLEQ